MPKRKGEIAIDKNFKNGHIPLTLISIVNEKSYVHSCIAIVSTLIHKVHWHVLVLLCLPNFMISYIRNVLCSLLKDQFLNH